MAHGWRSMVINTQERALSVDINRLQRFKEQDTAELLRYLLDVGQSNDDDAIGTMVEPNTVETPLRAEIINGLMVKPQGGSLDLLVDAGLALIMNPDAAADESNYKYVRDDGVTILGTLLITANASGSTRIDVIECRINATPSSVTDSRDIFNPTTGLFAAATVTKEQRGRLEYRVRAGVPGAGMPANQAGWLPLCVASVPNGTVSNDTVTFWDVRPLVSDRVRNLSANGQAWPSVEKRHLFSDNQTVGGQFRLYGRLTAQIGGRRVGGVLRNGGPGTSTEYVDLDAAANQATDYTNPAPAAFEALRYLYILTPFGLPRWARYTDGPAGRVPRAPCGLFVISNTKPFANGAPSVAIGLPTATGLGGTTTTGTMVAPIAIDSGGKWLFHVQDNRLTFNEQVELPGAIRTSAPAIYTSEFTLTEGVDFPSNAKAIYLMFTCSLTLAAGDTAYALEPAFHVEIPGIGFVGDWYVEWLTDKWIRGDGIGGTSPEIRWSMRVPIPPNTNPAAAVSTFKLRVDHQFLKSDTAAAIPTASHEIFTVGYEL